MMNQSLPYGRISTEAYQLRLAAIDMEHATTLRDDAALFRAYCEILVHWERIRDLVAGRTNTST